MPICSRWAGNVYGTNTGNLYLSIQGDDNSLKGKLRHNDPVFGVAVFEVEGVFDGTSLKFVGKPTSHPQGIEVGNFRARATLDSRGQLTGEWDSNAGTGGTFILHPHDYEIGEPSAQQSSQLHTARYSFGAVDIDRDELTSIAERLQSHFDRARVIVTVVSGTEQARFLENFKEATFSTSSASGAKLYVQEPEAGGLNRVAQIEFGPQVNYAMVQGGNDAWVLGLLEKLKQYVTPYTRNYLTSYRKYGVGAFQLLALATAVAALPDIGSFWRRATFSIGVVLLLLAVAKLDEKWIPFANIHLHRRSTGLLGGLAPHIISLIIAVAATLIATIMLAFLKGWMPAG